MESAVGLSPDLLFIESVNLMRKKCRTFLNELEKGIWWLIIPLLNFNIWQQQHTVFSTRVYLPISSLSSSSCNQSAWDRIHKQTQTHIHTLNAVHSSNLGTSLYLLCRAAVSAHSSSSSFCLVLIQRQEMQKRQGVYQSYTTRVIRPTEELIEFCYLWVVSACGGGARFRTVMKLSITLLLLRLLLLPKCVDWCAHREKDDLMVVRAVPSKRKAEWDVM